MANVNREEVIKNTFEKVKKGIEKCTWRYDILIEKSFDDEWIKYLGKAFYVTSDYTVVTELKEYQWEQRYDYKFVIRQEGKDILPEIYEKYVLDGIVTQGYSDTERKVIKEYLEILKFAQIKADLKMVDSLPE